ncbi:hypothetical protein QTP88_024889 [Uroleucon formosanum]
MTELLEGVRTDDCAPQRRAAGLTTNSPTYRETAVHRRAIPNKSIATGQKHVVCERIVRMSNNIHRENGTSGNEVRTKTASKHKAAMRLAEELIYMGKTVTPPTKKKGRPPNTPSPTVKKKIVFRKSKIKTYRLTAIDIYST